MTPYEPWSKQDKQAILEKIEAATKEITILQAFILAQEARLAEGCWYMDWRNETKEGKCQ